MNAGIGVALSSFGFVVGLTLNTAISEEIQLPNISYPTHTAQSAVFTIDRLHKLKLGDIKSVEDSMEFWLMVDAKVMHEIITSRESTKEETTKLYQMLRLLSVMNEKFVIKQWRSDSELLKIFKQAQENDQTHTSKLRCFNWEKPMWVDTKGCT